MFSLYLNASRLLVKQVRWTSKFTDQPDLTSKVKVKELISSMPKEERQVMYDLLRKEVVNDLAARQSFSKPANRLMSWIFGTSFSAKLKKYIKGPTSSQLGSLFAFHALPYVAFGTMDNCIMIMSGDYIQATIGSTMGLSTLSSAALGNTVANSTSIAVAYHVERLFTKRIKGASSMSVEQFKLRRTRLVIQSARIIGIIAGCILGMAPLLITQH